MPGIDVDISLLKKFPRCPTHEIACVIKTGTRTGSSYGKSFFICNSSSSPCNFALPAEQWKPNQCPQHDKLVELKAIQKKHDMFKCYYRCVTGKQNGSWCGNQVISSSGTQVAAPLKDISNDPHGQKEHLSNRQLKEQCLIVNNALRDVSNDKHRQQLLQQQQPRQSLKSHNIPAKASNELMGQKATEDSMTLPTEIVSLQTQSLSATSDQTSELNQRDQEEDTSNNSSSSNNSNLESSASSDGKGDDTSGYSSEDTRTNLSNDDAKTTQLVSKDANANFTKNKQSSSSVDSSKDFLSESFTVHSLQKTMSTTIDLISSDDESDDDKSNNDDSEDEGLTNGGEVFALPNEMTTSVENNSQQVKRFPVVRDQKSQTSTSNQTSIINQQSLSRPPLASNISNGKVDSAVTRPKDSSEVDKVVPFRNLDEYYHNKAVLQKQLDQQLSLYQRVHKHAPDGGKKLESQIQSLINSINDLRFRKPQNTESTDSSNHLGRSSSSQAHSSTSSSQDSTSSFNQYPRSGYTDQASTINQQRQAIMVHPQAMNHPAMSAMYYQQQHLFGGRMTASRLQEVGRVTKGAIEQLHLSLESCPPASEEADDPDGLKVTLMTHQRQAIAWLLWREKQIPSGGILADDMGLGKTLTMISLVLKSRQLEKDKERRETKLINSGATLVVCPASLVHQWHKEVENRVKKMEMRVCIYHGPSREKRPMKVAANDIVLTTYNIVAIEGKAFVEEEKGNKKGATQTEWLGKDVGEEKIEPGLLFKIHWRRIVLDEGHQIKNHKTAASISVSKLESDSRWVVTGTPIQNETMDMYALVKFLRLSPFNELKVWKREVDNKSNVGTKRLNTIVSSLLLRRTKDQKNKQTGKPLVSLPNRSCVVHKIQLSSDEQDCYSVIHQFSKNMFTQFLDSRKDAVPGHSTSSHGKPGTDSNQNQPEIILGMSKEQVLDMFGLSNINAQRSGCLLVMVLRLRQCCGHVSLMCEPIEADLCKSEGIDVPIEEQLGNMSIDESNQLQSRPKQLKPSFESTKVKEVLKVLRELREQSVGGKRPKSVIVSQWTRMLEIIHLHLKRNNITAEYITGSVPAKKRSDIVERFNNEHDPEVLLVSLKAGGVGLNLIGGNHLFLIDQHWNPALEDQACDRVYRVGQRKDVVIHKFLCLNTVEERIVQLQEKKKSLADSVLHGGKATGQQKLTLNDLKMIFGIS